MVNKYGADALRLYLINSPVVSAPPRPGRLHPIDSPHCLTRSCYFVLA